MEKGNGVKIKKIVITGPESTGKSTLTMELARYYNTCYVGEYARYFVQNINRPYTYQDIEHIAERQLEMILEAEKKATRFLFIDTYLIIIKIWFQEIYDKYPKWIDKILDKKEIDLFLVCDTDLPWIYDPVRENSGDRREYLLNRYINELDNLKYNYILVKDKDSKRMKNAVKAIDTIFKQK